MKLSQQSSLVWYFLENGLIDSALFHAEFLYELQSQTNDEARYLYALANLRAGQYKAAFAIAESAKSHVGCKYIYAQAASKLGQPRLAIDALKSILSSCKPFRDPSLGLDTPRSSTPDISAVYLLLGHCYRKAKQINNAVSCLVKALNINPYAWEAFEALCELGVELHLGNLFLNEPSQALSSPQNQNQNQNFNQNGHQISALLLPNTPVPASNPNNTTNNFLGNTLSNPNLVLNNPNHNNNNNNNHLPNNPNNNNSNNAAYMGMASSTSKPSLLSLGSFDQSSHALGNTSVSDTSSMTPLSYLAPKYKTRLAKKQTDAWAGPETPSGMPSLPTATTMPLPPSSMMTTNSSTPSSSNTRTRLDAILTDAKTNKNMSGDFDQSTNHNTDSFTFAKARIEQIDINDSVLKFQYSLALPISYMSKYRTRDAYALLTALPPPIKNSAFVQHLIARCCFEQVNYKEAVEHFELLREKQPWRVRDMEIFSTTLWHLRNEVGLACLAKETLEIDIYKPQPWCALANCFSLQREHSAALTCIERAIQLDPQFAYAYTLRGHEQVASEEFEAAQTSYRKALEIDRRHYNAWYGLGMVYLKTGKDAEADIHIKKAAEINPYNSVLLCCVGIILERSKRMNEALKIYSRACELAPDSALALFKKAKVLISTGKSNEALQCLQELQKVAPDEPNVHFLLGKLYKHMGCKSSSVRHLTIAMNLDQKASHLIKETLEMLHQK